MTAKRTREISAEEVRQWRQVKSPGIRVKTEADQGTYTDPNDPAVGVHTLLVNGEFVVARGQLDSERRSRPANPAHRARQLATQATPESTTPPGRMARSTMAKRIGEQTGDGFLYSRVFALLTPCTCGVVSAQDYDLVILNGRVMELRDAERRRDASSHRPIASRAARDSNGSLRRPGRGCRDVRERLSLRLVPSALSTNELCDPVNSANLVELWLSSEFAARSMRRDERVEDDFEHHGLISGGCANLAGCSTDGIFRRHSRSNCPTSCTQHSR